MKKGIIYFLEKWWLPLSIIILLMIVEIYFGNYIVHLRPIEIMMEFFFVLSIIAIISSIFYQFISKRWLKGLLSIFMFLSVLGLFGFISLFTNSDDGFADNLKIPHNIEINDTTSWKSKVCHHKNLYQDYILNSLKAKESYTSRISAILTSLNRLNLDNKEVLLRYLSTNPSWRVFTERGYKYATRRWNYNGNWIYTLNGYYTNFEFYLFGKGDTIPQFQNRFTIGLSNKKWIRNLRSSTEIRIADTKDVNISSGNNLNGSMVILEGDNILVEIFDQSSRRDRIMTQAAIDYSEAEFNKILVNPTFENIKQILPDSSIRCGKLNFELHNSIQPGIYEYEIWVNPQESGMVYLKAYEITKNIPLSAESLKQSTNEWVGWSDNSQELFYSNSNFTIYEGDWGKPYAARFELWFVPDSGKPERILLEKNFKIEGWQR